MKMENLVDYKIEMNTDEGQTSFTTELLNGKLYSLLIDSEEKCQIIIDSMLGYIIFHRHDIEGVNLYFPRCYSTTPELDVLTQANYPSNEMFSLNEPITITLIGQKNKRVSFLFKFE